jgi:hypothetical protein
MDATILGNFDVITRDVVPDFTKTGKWYEFYTGDSLDVQNVSAKLTFKPGEYRLYTTVKLTKPIFTAIDEVRFDDLADGRKVISFPNPSDGVFTVAVNLPSASKQLEISILNIHGRIIGKTYIMDPHQGVNEFTLNLQELCQGKPPDGMYLIRISGGNFLETHKIVVK